MNIVSDAQTIANPDKFEYNLLGLILYSFSRSKGWQSANTFNIFFNMGMLFIISHEMSNMFSLIAMLLGFIAFTAKVVDGYEHAKKKWEDNKKGQWETVPVMTTNSYRGGTRVRN